MSLKTKFIIFLLLFCFAVAVNIQAAAWSNRFLLVDATTVFEATYKAISITEYLNDDLQKQEQAVLAAFDKQHVSPDDRQQIEELNDVVALDIQRLAELGEQLPLSDAVDSFRTEARKHTLQIEHYLDAPRTPEFQAKLPAFREEFVTNHVALLNALRRVGDTLTNAQRQATGAVLSTPDTVNIILAGMAAVELVILLIVLSLFRNWMLRPIGKIRTATEEIAAGNLDYRITEQHSDELGALAREVNHMAASLSRAQRELKRRERMAAVGEMVSVVAHNIRNPLAGIRATAQASRNEPHGAKQFRQQQDRIIKTVDSLEQWLKELLHLNRPLELKLEPTDVDQLISDLESIFLPTVQRKQVSIQYAPSSVDQRISIDRQHFVQAVSSILDNAIEAAPPGSTVRISTGIASNAEDYFYIDISDTGSGVPETLKRQVFEPYFSTKPGGTGIGLSMAKKIVEAHSGKITLVDCANGDGRHETTFRISIPNLRRHRTGASKHGKPADR